MGLNKTLEWRRNKLAALIKELLSYKTFTYDPTVDDSPIIIGRGKEVKDCTFTEKYKQRYEGLLKKIFLSEKSDFEYANNKGKKFTRDDIIANSIYFFSKYKIDLNYSFSAITDKRLFLRLIYTQFVKILNYLFDDAEYDFSDDESECDKEYEKFLAKMRSDFNKHDIIYRLYNGAYISDIECFYDKDHNQKECHDCYLFFMKSNIMSGVDSLINQLTGLFYLTTPTMYSDHATYIARENRKKSRLGYASYSNIGYIKFFQQKVVFSSPLFYGILTNRTKEAVSVKSQQSDDTRRWYETSENDEIMKRIIGKIYDYKNNKYGMTLEIDPGICLNLIDHVLDEIAQISYNDFFEEKKMPDSLVESFSAFSQKACCALYIEDKDERMAFYKYMFVVYIDRFFRAAKRLIDFCKTSAASKAECLRLIEKIKKHAGICNFSNYKVSYEEFYQKKHDIISQNMWMIMGKTDWESFDEMIAKASNDIYNPFEMIINGYTELCQRLDELKKTLSAE